MPGNRQDIGFVQVVEGGRTPEKKTEEVVLAGVVPETDFVLFERLVRGVFSNRNFRELNSREAMSVSGLAEEAYVGRVGRVLWDKVVTASQKPYRAGYGRWEMVRGDKRPKRTGFEPYFYHREAVGEELMERVLEFTKGVMRKMDRLNDIYGWGTTSRFSRVLAGNWDPDNIRHYGAALVLYGEFGRMVGQLREQMGPEAREFNWLLRSNVNESTVPNFVYKDGDNGDLERTITIKRKPKNGELPEMNGAYYRAMVRTGEISTDPALMALHIGMMGDPLVRTMMHATQNPEMVLEPGLSAREYGEMFRVS